MNILLVAVVAVLVVSALNGMKRGLVKTVFSMFSLLVALLLTAVFSPIVTKQLQSNEKVVGYFSEKVASVLPFEEHKQLGQQGSKAAGTGEQGKFLESLPLPESIRESLLENNSQSFYKALGVDTFGEYLSNCLASMIISALSFAGTFIIIFILLKVLCFSLDLISKLPLLNQANHLLGMAAGFLNALIVIWILCIVLTAFGSTEFGRKLMMMVNESSFLSFIYNNNLLLGKVTDLTKIFQ